MNEYKENLLYADIGKELIETEDIFDHIRQNKIRIRYLESSKPAGKSKRVVLGECRMLKQRTVDMLLAVGFKEEEIPQFCIIVFKERIPGFTKEQLKILIMHELMHIGVKEDSEIGEPTFHITKHDLEDFRYIIDRFGSDWADDKSQITWQQLQKAEPVVDTETGEILEAAEI